MTEIQFEMQEIEKDFKDFYEHSGSDLYDHASSLEEFRQILADGPEKYRHLLIDRLGRFLTEENFFSDGEDISVYQHYRYLPPIYHGHDFFEVAFVLSGNFYNFIGDKNLPLYPGDVLILAPRTSHAVCSCSDDSIMINILIRSTVFDEHFMKVLNGDDPLHDFFVETLYRSSPSPYLLFKAGEDEEMTKCVLEICREFSRNRQYRNTMLVALVSIFLVTLLRKHEKDVLIPSVNPAVINETAIFILQYMQKNCATITLSHLADFFNYSERQMQRIITTATGKSFSENIKNLRMQKAAHLLRDTPQTVTEIAYSLGYYDASNFRRVFKSVYHVTPQQYRENSPCNLPDETSEVVPDQTREP